MHLCAAYVHGLLCSCNRRCMCLHGVRNQIVECILHQFVCGWGACSNSDTFQAKKQVSPEAKLWASIANIHDRFVVYRSSAAGACSPAVVLINSILFIYLNLEEVHNENLCRSYLF